MIDMISGVQRAFRITFISVEKYDTNILIKLVSYVNKINYILSTAANFVEFIYRYTKTVCFFLVFFGFQLTN